MEVNKFVDLVKEETGVIMENSEKVERAVYGSASNQGLTGGVGQDASAQEILAKYDQLGGYITKNTYKVKNGVFYDKETKQPVENPEITLLIKVNGEVVEQPEGAPESLEVKVAKKQHKEKVGKKGKK